MATEHCCLADYRMRKQSRTEVFQVHRWVMYNEIRSTFMSVFFFNVSPKWYPLFLFIAAVTMDVWPTFWLNENVVSGICSSSLKTEFFAACISNSLPSKSRLNDVNSTFDRSRIFRLLLTMTCLKIQRKPQHLLWRSIGPPAPGWFHEHVWQLPLFAWLSSALLFPWNFRWTVWQLLVCVQLRGVLPSARWVRWTVWQLLVRVGLRGVVPSARWFRWSIWELLVCIQARDALPSARLFWTADSLGHFPCVWKVRLYSLSRHSFIKDFFSLSSYCRYFIKVKKFPATFTRRSHKNRAKTAVSPMTSSPDKHTHTSRLDCSALRATLLCTSSSRTSPPTNKPTPRGSIARPCAPRCSAPVAPGHRHQQTNPHLEARLLGRARHVALHQITMSHM